MRIDPVIPSLITKSDDPSIINYYQDYANTQSRRMMDFEILKKTVEKLSPDEKASILPATLPSDKCARILGFIIKVNTVPGTHLIDIAASSPNKEGLAPLLNNFMEVFLEKVRKGNEMQDSDRLLYLRNEKQSLLTEIMAIEAKLNILTKEISTADYAETYNIASKKTEELQRLYVNAFVDRLATENRFLEVEKSGRELQSLSLDPMVEEMVMGDQSLDFTSSWTYQQQQQLRSTTDGLTPNNPDRIYVEQRMKAMQNYEKTLQNEVRKTAKSIVYGKRDYDLRKELIQSRNKSEKTRKTEEEIKKELDVSKEESVRISLGLHLGESLSSLLKHKRDLLDRIDTRIHELEVEGKAPLRIAIESLAREPDQPKGSNTQKLLMMFFAVSFGSVSILFLGFEFFDNRIRRPEDIRQALGYPPARPIVKAPDTILFHELMIRAPLEPAAQAISSLAIGFNLEKKNNNARIIMFTGVDSGVGTTSLALNCAHALARIVPKVLLIEGNFLTPSLSTLAGLSASPKGLADFLQGSGSVSDYIVNSSEQMLEIIHAGTVSEKTTSQHRIRELLEEVKNRYDFICIDCSPVTGSDMTENFALHSDIIALICLADSTLYKDLRRAAELLIRLEVPAIAPVLNLGGNKRAISIDKLLERKPEFLNKINTRNIEELIRNLPPASQLFDTIKKRVTGFMQSAKKRFDKLLKKKQNPS
jgi:Mrp family chromosome partitioning ATPase